MREIKCRAKSQITGDWIIGTYIDGYIINGVIEANSEYISIENWEAVHPESVGEYTGLTDKNGVEIYEGDIVAASFWDDEQKIYSETASVEFDEGSFILKIPNDEWSYFNGTQSVEVIGNIHEHSRLLGGEAE